MASRKLILKNYYRLKGSNFWLYYSLDVCVAAIIQQKVYQILHCHAEKKMYTSLGNFFIIRDWKHLKTRYSRGQTFDIAVKMPLGMPTFQFRVPGQVPVPLLLTWVATSEHPGRQHIMAQVLPDTHTGETWDKLCGHSSSRA